MTLKSQKKTDEDKHIYLADIYDEEFFQEIIGDDKYVIFDKEKVVKEIGSRDKMDKNVFNHVLNIEISKVLIKLLRNKRVKSIIYLMYTADVNKIKNVFEDHLLLQLNSNLKLGYSIITCADDYEEYEYNKIEKDYSNIYYRE